MHFKCREGVFVVNAFTWLNIVCRYRYANISVLYIYRFSTRGISNIICIIGFMWRRTNSISVDSSNYSTLLYILSRPNYGIRKMNILFQFNFRLNTYIYIYVYIWINQFLTKKAASFFFSLYIHIYLYISIYIFVLVHPWEAYFSYCWCVKYVDQYVVLMLKCHQFALTSYPQYPVSSNHRQFFIGLHINLVELLYSTWFISEYDHLQCMHGIF